MKEYIIMKELLGAPLHEIIKFEEEYYSIYEKRLRRLNKWKPKAEKASLQKEFDLSIDLSEKSHKIAKEIKNGYDKFRSLLPKNEIDLIRKFKIPSPEDARNMLKDKSHPNLNYEEIDKILNINFEMANDILIETFQNTAFKELTVEDAILKKKPDIREVDKISVATYVDLIANFYESTIMHLTTCTKFVQLGMIYRGILYTSILETEGNKLDKKILFDNLKALGFEAAGFIIPGLGAIKKLIELIDYFSDSDQEPGLIRDSGFVKEFLNRYTNVLNEWILIAIAQRDAINQSMKSIRKLID